MAGFGIGSLRELGEALGKNADDLVKGATKSTGKNAVNNAKKQVLKELQGEFDEIGTKAAQWGGIADFSKMNQSDQLDLVRRYRTHMDDMRANPEARRARLEELRSKEAAPERVVSNKLDGETPQQAWRRQQSEQRRQSPLTAEQRAEKGHTSGRSYDEYHEATTRAEKKRRGEEVTQRRIDREARQMEKEAAERQAQLEARKEEIRQRIADRKAGKPVQEKGDLEGMGGERSRSVPQPEAQRLINEARRGGVNEARTPTRQTSVFNTNDALEDANRSPLGRAFHNVTHRSHRPSTQDRRALNQSIDAYNRMHPEQQIDYVTSNRQMRQMQRQYGEDFDVSDIERANQEAAAKAQEHAEWWANKKSGIAEFAQNNQIITAAGIATAGIGLISILDDDD